jgi:hypothetical protein
VAGAFAPSAPWGATRSLRRPPASAHTGPQSRRQHGARACSRPGPRHTRFRWL